MALFIRPWQLLLATVVFLLAALLPHQLLSSSNLSRATSFNSTGMPSFLSSLFSPSSSNTSDKMSSASDKPLPKGKSESEWRAQLSPEQFRILRQKGTEMAGSGKYNKHYEEGVYTCAGCATPLYTSSSKFDSGCGWPAHFEALPGAVDRHVDNSWGMKRIEITCAACGGHLGHVFENEGFRELPSPPNFFFFFPSFLLSSPES